MLNIEKAHILVTKLLDMVKTFDTMYKKTSVMADKVETSKKYKEYTDLCQQSVAYITMMEHYSKNAEFHSLQNDLLMEALVAKQKQLNRYEAIADLIANDELDTHVDRVREIFKELHKEKN